MAFKIGVLGPINIDLILRGDAPRDFEALKTWSGPSDVHCILAGAAGYVSQDLKKLGNEVRLVSCVSDDPFGDLLLRALDRAGIASTHVLVEEGSDSAIAIYVLLLGENKRPLTFRLPTHHGWPPEMSPETRKYLLGTNLLHCCGYLHFPDLWTEEVPNLLREAKAKGVPTSLDPQFPLAPLEPPWLPALEPLLPHLDILMVDESEATNITGEENAEAAVDILAERVPILTVKLGERGVLVKGGGETFEVPAVPPKTFEDSIGAGDAFDAGFLQGILEGQPLEVAAKMGVTTASLSLEGVGGTATFPAREQLNF
ncbi:MAG TPA: carbohydrate kinase family protein [Candidatus Lokiarchaeia archaeon]|nr:carbohydrate kinase family protein [Candidatus Lokiarchaeia archaeon]